MRDSNLKPVHPGEILREELLIPLKVSVEKLARDIEVDKKVIQRIIEERENITPDIALKLSSRFKQSAQFWLNCQKDYENDCLEEIIIKNKEQLEKSIRIYRITPSIIVVSNHYHLKEFFVLSTFFNRIQMPRLE